MPQLYDATQDARFVSEPTSSKFNVSLLVRKRTRARRWALLTCPQTTEPARK